MFRSLPIFSLLLNTEKFGKNKYFWVNPWMFGSAWSHGTNPSCFNRLWDDNVGWQSSPIRREKQEEIKSCLISSFIDQTWLIKYQTCIQSPNYFGGFSIRWRSSRSQVRAGLYLGRPRLCDKGRSVTSCRDGQEACSFKWVIHLQRKPTETIISCTVNQAQPAYVIAVQTI